MATVKLDQVDRERRPEPFSLELSDGTEVFFADPKKMHWTQLTELDNLAPAKQIEALIEDPEQFQAFRDDSAIDGEVLEWVMAQWRDHFGLGGPGEAGSSPGS